MHTLARKNWLRNLHTRRCESWCVTIGPTVQWNSLSSQIFNMFKLNKIAFSLYSSLLSIRYFKLGSLPKVRHRFQLLFFFKRTILLLIHHQFLQFWYQCIKRTSIYHIFGNFPPNCHHITGKMDKVYKFLQSPVQSAKFTCVDDLCTQKKLENPPVQRYTKWPQRMISNGGWGRWLANGA